MNKERRAKLDELYNRLAVLQTEVENLTDADSIKDELETLKDEEQGALDNSPESIQNGDKGAAMAEAVSNMETAHDKLEEIATAITTLKDDITEALEAIDNAKADA
jgi:DNA repair exonuclease SbcCD ATPase subunit